MFKETSVLSIRNVSKTYSTGLIALNSISLEIPKGMYGLLGPNGAGKSTLMRTLATLQRPDSGSIELDGIDLLGRGEEIRKSLGYLPQEFGLYPKSRAGELLDYFAVLKGIHTRNARKEVCETLLKQTNLWDKRNQRVGGFSGGMKQRFGVAVALLGNPKLLIVDEPTAGLDPAERVRFLNLLSELSEHSVVILSTHIVEDVSEVCAHMAIIDKGRILLQSTPAQAVNELQGKIWKKLADREELLRLGELPGVLSAKVLGAKVLLHLFSTDDPGAGFEPASPDLEDVYFHAIANNRFAQEQLGREEAI